ncbi:uncharacterized protein ARMOST_00116 [Armillaria ostoyae]|uniref:Uncharacterized protein n=1 Tax=Armillaria ostoyae TaxID=47428 RepID=A0A284QKA0_ARMOS|nr:uncharacterized protein ARMOST_00116 [Armillaria ostoyae]
MVDRAYAESSRPIWSTPVLRYLQTGLLEQQLLQDGEPLLLLCSSYVGIAQQLRHDIILEPIAIKNFAHTRSSRDYFIA